MYSLKYKNVFFNHLQLFLRFLHYPPPELLHHLLQFSSSSIFVEFLYNLLSLSLSKKFPLDEKKQPNIQAVLQLLKSHHFNNTLLAALILKCPEFLRCRVKSNLQPKFEYLQEIGFKGELLPPFILSNPSIAFKSLVHQIKSSFELLRSVIDSNESILLAIKRAPWLLTSNLKGSLRPNIDFLLKEGVPVNLVSKFLIMHPRGILQKFDKVVCASNSIRNLGFEPSALQMSDSTWKKKIEIMKSMGFSEMEILKAFKRCPYFLTGSEEKLRDKMDFYVNTIKMEPANLIASPVLFRLSIEKRVYPRYNVLMILKSKNKIKDVRQTSLFKLGEKNFREKYVDRFRDEMPGLLEAYLGTKETKKIDV